MVQRLIHAGHECVVFDVSADAVKRVAKEKAIVASSLDDFAKLKAPRVTWMMVPAGVVEQTVTELAEGFEQGDIIVNGGNSHYIDDIRRAKDLKPQGIHYVDSGTSGGVWGIERGFCQMIGGEPDVVKHLDPIFAALAPPVDSAPRTQGREKIKGGTAEHGYLHCGPNGAGHFVKMVHAETAPIRSPELYQYDFNLTEVTEVWCRGSVIASWLLDLTAAALLEDPELKKFGGRVSNSGEGCWKIDSAIDEGVLANVLSAALYARFASRGAAEFAEKLLSAMRYEFGGHLEKPAAKTGDR